MFLVMILTLYTTRIVLSELGLSDYGIYDVIAGVVASLSFINQSLASANQRFLAFAIGEGREDDLKEVYRVSITIFVVLGLLILILGETVGIWFVKTKLSIPIERQSAAILLYHFSLFSFLFSFVTIPFIAEIIAHEEMKIFAVIGIVDYFLKLIVAFLLSVGNYDKLVLYGFLTLLVYITVFIVYVIICRKKFTECRGFKIPKDFGLFKKIISYSGWTMLGSIAGVAYNQGVTVLVNIFFATVVNAARAVTTQVIGAISALANNFFTALRPAIIKSYANGDTKHMMRLFYSSSKLSYYLMFILCLPIYLEMEFILNLWLKETNEQMVLFTKLALVYSIILSLNNPITTVIQATGNIRNYHIFVESFTLLILPTTYLFFKLGYKPEVTYIISIFAFSLAHIIRMIVLRSNIKEFKLSDYFKNFLNSAILVSILSIIVPIALESKLEYGLLRFILVVTSSILLVSVFTYNFGLDAEEKNKIKSIIVKFRN